MVKTRSMNITLAENDYAELESFANHQGESIAELILEAVRERMELWEDLRDIEARKDEPTSTLEEVMERLGLTDV